jgi:NYN domain
VASGCLVLVDGWNHFLAAQKCFGRDAARKFPVDRLAWHAAAQAGEETLVGVVVFMAIPDQRQPGELAEYHAWRKRHRKLQNFGVQRPRSVRFTYHDLFCPSCKQPLDRAVKCPECGARSQLSGWKEEKGADVGLAARAVHGAWNQEYSSLVIFSQDSDYRPLTDQLREIHLAQGREYRLFSAFPDCGGGHAHWGVPGTKQLPLDAITYADLAARPFTRVDQVLSPAT